MQPNGPVLVHGRPLFDDASALFHSKRAVVQPKRSIPGNDAFWHGDTLPRDQ